MCGKRAPDMACGRLHDIEEKVWDEVEMEMLTSVSMEHHPLNANQHEQLQSEIRIARATMCALLRLKLDYWNRLPWILVALACDDEVYSDHGSFGVITYFNLREFVKLPPSWPPARVERGAFYWLSWFYECF